MWQTIKDIAGLLFGGSKWAMVAIIVSLVGAGIFVVMGINDLQSQLRIAQTNNETLKTNIEKLETSIEEQNRTIDRYKKLLALSGDISKDLVNNINTRAIEMNKLRKKLNVLAGNTVIKKPTEFEVKVNEAMKTINDCFGELSRKQLTLGIEIDEQAPNCAVDRLPDFNGLY